MADKLIGLLGMCRRCGKLVAGFDAVAALCRDERVLLLLAADASPRTVKELRFRAGGHPLYRLPLSKDAVAHAVGSHKPIACLAVEDDGFSRAIRPLVSLLDETEEESRYDD